MLDIQASSVCQPESEPAGFEITSKSGWIQENYHAKARNKIDPKVVPSAALEKRTRRMFSTDYKLSIIRQADACQHGELGKLLRREKLYSNQLSQWRRELEQHGVDGLKKSTPEPAPKKSADQKRIEQLEK